jgi:hypothetical protein
MYRPKQWLQFWIVTLLFAAGALRTAHLDFRVQALFSAMTRWERPSSHLIQKEEASLVLRQWE